MLIQHQAPSLRPQASAHLAQTMTLLSLTVDEMQARIDAALASNPALEQVEARHCAGCGRLLLPANGGYLERRCPVCRRLEQPADSTPIVFVSHRDDFSSPRGPLSAEDLPAEELTAESADLPTFVLRQIAAELLPDERILAAHLLTGLDEDGLLTTPLLEIARYHHVPLARLEAVLHLIQLAEPVGVGASSPQEALLVQLEVLGEIQAVPPLAGRAIREGMHLLSRHRSHELGKLLGIPEYQATELGHFIADNLNPFPGRSHWGDVHQGRAAPAATYHRPDVVISRLSEDEHTPLVVEVLSPLAGSLRLNPLFREAIRQAGRPSTGMPEEGNDLWGGNPSPSTGPDEKWAADYQQASLLIKCVQQRNQAIVRLMERLVVLQRAFILHGAAHLRPLTRAQLAPELQVHESTISRAVSAKSVQLPEGRIIPLALFFDRSLSMRLAVKAIIAQERKGRAPLSDSEIVELMRRQGYKIARRTVAKYRAVEGILPSFLRSPGNDKP